MKLPEIFLFIASLIWPLSAFIFVYGLGYFLISFSGMALSVLFFGITFLIFATLLVLAFGIVTG